MPEKAKTQLPEKSNTSTLVEKRIENEKLATPGSMILINPPERTAMRRGKAGTTKAMGHSLLAGDRGAVVGAEVQGHPARNQPHEGSSKWPSSSLHGRPSTTNRIPIHSRGAALPSSSKVQNAVDRDVRRNKRPHRPPQYIQKSDGTARISRPRTMQSLRYHTEGPSIGLV